MDNPFAIANNILQIIKDSKKFLYLISPYIQFERNESTELKLIKDAIFDQNFKTMVGDVDQQFIDILKEFQERGNNNAHS